MFVKFRSRPVLDIFGLGLETLSLESKVVNKYKIQLFSYSVESHNATDNKKYTII